MRTQARFQQMADDPLLTESGEDIKINGADTETPGPA
jgi:hypothetical protein